MNIDMIWAEFEQKVKEALNKESIDSDANLMDMGINSITLMKLAAFLRRNKVKVNFGQLIKNPTMSNWRKLIEETIKKAEEKDEKKAEAKDKSLAGEIDGKENIVSEDDDKTEITFDLTDVQYAYWAGRQDDQELGGVGCHAYFEFDGQGNDQDRLKKAWYEVQDAHPMLRAIFTEDGKQKIIANPSYIEPVFHDLRDLSTEESEDRLKEIRERLSHEKLKVEMGQNAHLEVAFFKDNKRRIFLDVDLLVADVASVHLLIMDLTKACAGEKLHRYEMGCFKNYLDKRKADEEVLSEDETYWKERIKDFPDDAINLPLRVSAGEIKKNHFKRISKSFSEEIWDVIKAKAAGYGLSPAMTLLTAYANVLGRYSSQDKFLINIPLFNRFDDDPLTEGMIADFTNLLLLNTDNPSGLSFLKQAKKIKESFSLDISHSSYSGVKVERELSKYSGSIKNIAPVVFACNIDFPFETKESEKVLGKLTYMISQTPQVWLDFQSFTDMGKLILCWDYVEELFDKKVIEEMFSSLTEEMMSLYESDDWGQSFDVLPEKQRLRHEKEEDIFPLEVKDLSLLSGFIKNAVSLPDNAALYSVEDNKVTTYKELADISSRIGAYLRKNGVEKGDYVAVTLPRGYRQIYAIMGILYAGAVYVPVGVNQPRDRRIKIYEQIDIHFVISDSKTADSIELCCDNVINLDEAMAYKTMIPAVNSPDSSAYVIMTSGSTGVPKGVEITHKAAMNTIEYLCERYDFKEKDRMLMVSAIDFDLSVFDIFGMLYSGAAVVIPEEDSYKNPEVWLELIEKHGINRWNSVPILFDMLITYAEGKRKRVDLDTVFMSGDWIPLNLPQRFYDISKEGSLVIGMGGATEASIWSNYQEVPRILPAHWNSIPYGRPLKNQLYRVLDEKGNICPDYVMGELCIGGAGVAVGYRGDEELTARKFFSDEKNIRWYRTGDNGRTWDDGTIEFLGRRDNQVKVKGHRIELGEIENAIKKYPGIRGAAVLAVDYEGKQKRIVAFVQPEKNKIEENEEYLLPKHKFNLEEIEEGRKRIESIGILSDAFIRRALNTNKDSENSILEYWKKLDITDAAMEVEDSNDNKDIIEMYEKILEMLPDMLSKRIDPIEYFYDIASEYRPDQLLEKHKETKKANEILKRIIEMYPGKQNLRILEVGGRNPEFTKNILEALADRIESYTYLDNTGFFRYGYEEILKQYKRFEYKIKNLEAYYDEAECFDIIIIPEAIHRLKALDDVAKILGAITSKGGIVIGCEPSKQLKMIHTIPAILEEGFKDVDLCERGGDIIPDRDTLEKIFTSNGFERLYMSDDEEETATLSVVYAFRQKYADALDVNELRKYLEQEIPSYMIPFKYIKIQEFPLTRNKKIDRKQLADLIKEEKSSADETGDKEKTSTKTEEELAEILSNLLKISVVGRRDNFFSLGGDSLLATRLIAEVREKKGLLLSIRNIFENPEVKDLAAFIDDNEERLKVVKEEFIIDKENWDKEFPLTEVQFAYWIGRQGAFSLGNVATHCYYEYECQNINIPVFQKIWNDMVSYHGMLRAEIGNKGMQRILDKVPYYTIQTIHAENTSFDIEKSIIEDVREKMSTQVIDTKKWPLFDIRLTVLSKGRTIIHISFDNIILDGFSMFHILNEMQERYSNEVKGISNDRALPLISFRDYVMDLQRRRKSAKYDEDKKYWLDRLEEFSKAPQLPLVKSERDITIPKFKRRQYKLSKESWQKLRNVASDMEVTPTVFIITAYSDILRKYSKNKDISINLTQFGRNIPHKDAEKIVGDFTLLTLLESRNKKESSFRDRCQINSKQLTADMEHQLYSAVEFQRELRKRDDNAIDSIMPIVFTSGIGVKELNEKNDMGRLVYNISGTPQVWIDHQVFEQDGGLTINWDAVEELLSKELLDRMFEDYKKHLNEMIESSEKREEVLISENDENENKSEVSVTLSVEAGPNIEKYEDDHIRKIKEIWSDILGEKITDIDKSFFELGGDSLGIVKMINAIGEEYGTDLSIIDIINHNSIRMVAGLLESVVQEGII